MSQRRVWILFAFISILFYAFAEVLQKQGYDLKQDHSELKILIWFGVVSGITSFVIMLLGLKETSMTMLQIVEKNPAMIVLCVSVILYFILWILERRPYTFFEKAELSKIMGAGFDSLGMVFYMIAAAGNQIYTNVLISGFCVFTVLLSRLILKEKIEKRQTVWIAFTIACIIAFTVTDELF